MQIGMIGLGRMGGDMVRRLLEGGHDCVVYDRNPEAVAALSVTGASRSELGRGIRRKTRQTAGRLADGAGGGCR